MPKKLSIFSKAFENSHLDRNWSLLALFHAQISLAEQKGVAGKIVVISMTYNCFYQFEKP